MAKCKKSILITGDLSVVVLLKQCKASSIAALGLPAGQSVVVADRQHNKTMKVYK